jgi:oligopeptidase B
VDAFKDFFVLTERTGGLRRLRVLRAKVGEDYVIHFEHPAPVVWLDGNRVYDTQMLRFGFESLDTPESIFEFDTVTRERTLLKQKDLLGGFDRRAYIVERTWAPARDGVSVPITLIRSRETELDGSNPLLMYAYGSYGSSTEPWFNPEVFSLLDRGFVYAIAHIRGGQEMGRWWYEDGKLLNKKNTFTDFIACAEHLANEGYADPENLFAVGGSAGGLLVGAVMNMRPDLFNGIVSAVPFVDVVTTMLDDSIPLTTSEYDEWGNPNEKEYYDYMLSYSPYDQVEAKGYPNLLVTTSLHDSQVQYWEPAKWVAKLRAFKTDESRVLLKTEMQAGHGGVSGRYKRYEKTAFRYAFVIDLAGLDK